jgi:hypothetical protein
MKYTTKTHEFRVRTHLSYLRFPKPLILSLLNSEDKKRYGDEWLSYINKYKLTDLKLVEEVFFLEEVDQVERLVEFMRNDRQRPHVYDDMRLYIKQLDARRGKDFCKTFPMLAYMLNDSYYG